MTQPSNHRIAVLPGDGIGAEVITEAEKVLRAVGERFGHHFVTEKGMVGGVAMDRTGDPLPGATLALCQASDAVLFGAVGDPRYDDPQAKVRPEQALLGLRKGLGLFANLRPVHVYPALAEASPLRPELVRGVDLVVVRENCEDLYAGVEFERGLPATAEVIETVNRLSTDKKIRTRPDTTGVSIKPISEENSERIVRFAFVQNREQL